jgi:amino acid transporter
VRLHRLKRLFLGTPLPTAQQRHERLDKATALAVFASDPLSSVAYATEEILLVLILAGAIALSYSLPIGIGIAVLILIVVNSYRQTIRAYPQGGGACPA